MDISLRESNGVIKRKFQKLDSRSYERLRDGWIPELQEREKEKH